MLACTRSVGKRHFQPQEEVSSLFWWTTLWFSTPKLKHHVGWRHAAAIASVGCCFGTLELNSWPKCVLGQMDDYVMVVWAHEVSFSCLVHCRNCWLPSREATPPNSAKKPGPRWAFSTRPWGNSATTRSQWLPNTPTPHYYFISIFGRKKCVL